jgi:hypothetical protein
MPIRLVRFKEFAPQRGAEDFLAPRWGNATRFFSLLIGAPGKLTAELKEFH